MVARVRGNSYYHGFCIDRNLNLNLFFGVFDYEAINC